MLHCITSVLVALLSFASSPFLTLASRFQCYDRPTPGRILSPKDNLSQMQGATIELYWPDDGLWYRAEILSLNVRARSAKVLYSTGDIEQLSLDEVIQDGHLNVVRQ